MDKMLQTNPIYTTGVAKVSDPRAGYSAIYVVYGKIG